MIVAKNIERTKDGIKFPKIEWKESVFSGIIEKRNNIKLVKINK